MSEIKPVKWEVVSPGGSITACVDSIDDMPIDWTALPLYDESALAQARAEERERCARELEEVIGIEDTTGYQAAEVVRALDGRTEK